MCGPDKQSECLLYLGVSSYCTATTTNTATNTVDYTLTATLKTQTNNIFEIPVENETVSAKGVRNYQFCVDTVTDVKAQLKSYTSSCDCPSSYANLEFVVSRTNPSAVLTDLTWRLEAGETTGIVNLDQSSINTQPGTYYLNVLGTCQDTTQCTAANYCTCGPCANLPRSPYTLYIANTTTLANKGNSSLSLKTCSVQGVLHGESGVCSAFCPDYPQIPFSLVNALLAAGQGLGPGAVAAIVILVITFTLCASGGLLYYFRYYLPCYATVRLHCHFFSSIVFSSLILSSLSLVSLLFIVYSSSIFASLLFLIAFFILSSLPLFCLYTVSI